jgi:hypothetical protein
MHQSPAYENRLGFFNMLGCGWLVAYPKPLRVGQFYVVVFSSKVGQF